MLQLKALINPSKSLQINIITCFYGATTHLIGPFYTEIGTKFFFSPSVFILMNHGNKCKVKQLYMSNINAFKYDNDCYTYFIRQPFCTHKMPFLRH